MNKKITILLLAALALGAYAATKRTFKPGRNEAVIYPLFGLKTTTLQLDSGEALTSSYYWDVRALKRFDIQDVIGTITLTCKDSSGTDSVLVDLVVDGSYKLDGNGPWTPIDSIQVNSDAGAEATTADTITTALDYTVFRFRANNVEGESDVDEKSTCTAWWVYRKRGKEVN